MNDIVKFSGGVPANPEDLIAGLANVGQSIVSGGVPYLRLMKSGAWAYGAEKIEPEPDSEWAVNPTSIEHGWACWDDGELLGEQMVPFNQAVPPRGSLPDYGAEWSPQMAVVMQCLNGEDTGVSVMYKGTSKGLLSAMKDLINALVSQLQTDPGHYVPVVVFDQDSYDHKQYGQIFTPILDLKRWTSFDGVDAPNEDKSIAQEPDDETTGEGSEGQTPDSPPRRRRRRAAAADASPADDDSDNDGEKTSTSRKKAGRKNRRRRAS